MLNYISMTPKEKALYLLNLSTLTNFEEAKKIALFIVDEILSIKKEIWDDFHSEYFEYWQEVKKEIEKL